MSQLGYMFIAVGLGFYSTGFFISRFYTCIFKAMLFMGAGGIIIALHHEQNIFKIAQHRAKFTNYWNNIFNWVIAISEFLLFWILSKDAILAAAFQENNI